MYTAILLLFILYTFIIFGISNYFILLGLFIFNLVLALAFKVSIIKSLKFLKTVFLFSIFTVLVNLIFLDWMTAIMVGFRLFIVCNLTYIMSTILKPTYFARAITGLLLPLKLFNVNINDIALMITVCVSFIPILSDEYSSIKRTLLSRNYNVTLKRVLFEPHVFVYNFIDSIFRRIDELENALKSKGYN